MISYTPSAIVDPQLTEVNKMRHYQYETEMDVQKKENRSRVKKFLIAVDKASHGDYGGQVSFVNECTPVSISTMAVVATECLRF